MRTHMGLFPEVGRGGAWLQKELELELIKEGLWQLLALEPGGLRTDQAPHH